MKFLLTFVLSNILSVVIIISVLLFYNQIALGSGVLREELARLTDIRLLLLYIWRLFPIVITLGTSFTVLVSKKIQMSKNFHVWLAVLTGAYFIITFFWSMFYIEYNNYDIYKKIELKFLIGKYSVKGNDIYLRYYYDTEHSKIALGEHEGGTNFVNTDTNVEGQDSNAADQENVLIVLQNNTYFNLDEHKSNEELQSINNLRSDFFEKFNKKDFIKILEIENYGIGLLLEYYSNAIFKQIHDDKYRIILHAIAVACMMVAIMLFIGIAEKKLEVLFYLMIYIFWRSVVFVVLVEYVYLLFFTSVAVLIGMIITRLYLANHKQEER